MDVSVVIACCNQEHRLRLVLAGLRQQTIPIDKIEIIAVDDGSTDGTPEVLAKAAGILPLRVITLSPNEGRCRARNQGAMIARGELLAFLDGDALPHPDWLRSHWQAYQRSARPCLSCGILYCLPELEYISDPETGATEGNEVPSVVREYIRSHRAEMIITETMISAQFGLVERRARCGGYPTPESARLQEQVIGLFSQYPDSPVGWVGMYPHNAAVPRAAFAAAGGFDEDISFSEGWELSYRFQQHGLSIHLTPGAKTYHLYHYHPFTGRANGHREAIRRLQAIGYMARRHQQVRFLLVPLWLAGLWSDPFLPDEMVLEDLCALHHRFHDATPKELAEVRSLLLRHPIHGNIEGVQEVW